MYKEDKSKSKKPSEFSIELVVYLDEEDQIKDVFELNLGNNIIGSSPKDSTIVINKPEVEKKHLQIEIELDEKTNMLTPQIQSLKSEQGTQKKMKDGNFTSILPGKWTLMGDLSREFIFYIAKKYKCIVRKVAKNAKLNKSIDASSNQNSNPIPANKINFLKSLDNIEADVEENKKINQLETKSDIGQQNSKDMQQESAFSSKPKVFGKNFKPKGSPQDPGKNLHTKFKAPSTSSAVDASKQEPLKQSDSKNKMEVEKASKSLSNEKVNNKSETEPVVTLKIPSGPTPISSKNKTVDPKSNSKVVPKGNDEVKAEQKGKRKRGPNKKKDSEEVELSFDLSVEFSDDENNQKKIAKQQILNDKEMIKIASTDDEDEEDKQVSKQTGKKNDMIDENEEKKKNDKKQNGATKAANNKKETDTSTKKSTDNKKEAKINNKRKAQEANKDQSIIECEEEEQNTSKKEDLKNPNKQDQISEKKNQESAEVLAKKGGLKSSLAQNAFGQKKRKTEEGIVDKEKKLNQTMNDETIRKVEDKKEDKSKAIKSNDKKMEDENQQAVVNEQKKNNKPSILNKTPAQQPKTPSQQLKGEATKQEATKDNKKAAKEPPSKSVKQAKTEAKKQDKKKEQKKVQEKRNSIVKNNLDNEIDESEEELSHIINSDGEEEYVLKGSSASKQRQSKTTSKKFNVIFSNCGLDETDVQNRLSKLGVRIMKNLQQPFNVLIMDDFTRRAKTLVALNKGAKIISSQWVLDCICQERLIDDIDKYEIKVDKEFAKKHKFNFKEVQQRHQNQNKPIFSDIKFILPDDENYQNIIRDDLEHIIMTAGGSIVTEEDYDEIEDKSSIKVIFDNEKNDDSHISPAKNQSKTKSSESKKKIQDENRQKLIYAYKKNNFDCVLIESIFQSCLHQKLCNWTDFLV